jgi:hypothetical protein
MKIVYVGDTADFHFRDKVHFLANELCKQKLIVFSGVSIETLDPILLNSNKLNRVLRLDISLVAKVIDKNIVRNIVKASCYPINFLWLFFFKLFNKGAIFHSFTMYYIFLNALVGKGFIATPQASEVIHRMSSSKIYRNFAIFSLKRASLIIVDSNEMQSCLQIFGLKSIVHKNGFDTALPLRISKFNTVETKTKILSLRGIRPLYRIKEILNQRNQCELDNNISFVYPSFDKIYKNEVFQNTRKEDNDLGMLSKPDLYSLMSESLLCISIPETDSSPRSVYEAIFCGCIVAVTWAKYIDELPNCMKSRLIVIDLSSPNWLKDALSKAEEINVTKYNPSKEAIEMCDSKFLFRRLIYSFYNEK